jgi:hypothetical protein
MNLKKIVSFVFGTFCVVALVSCSAGAQPQTDVPLVRIGKTTSAPVIDGKLDDAAWKQSIAVSDFSITGSKTPAAQSTQVRFVYDNQNLYVSWRCEESLLIVAQQRMHEVRINAKKLDDDVLSDDSVVLFLQPGLNSKMREFDIIPSARYSTRKAIKRICGERATPPGIRMLKQPRFKKTAIGRRKSRFPGKPLISIIRPRRTPRGRWDWRVTQQAAASVPVGIQMIMLPSIW